MCQILIVIFLISKNLTKYLFFPSSFYAKFKIEIFKMQPEIISEVIEVS